MHVAWSHLPSSFQYQPRPSLIWTVGNCRFCWMAVCSEVPDWLHGQLACAVWVFWNFHCWRPPQIVGIVHGYDRHQMLLPSPQYRCLFLFSLALCTLLHVSVQWTWAGVTGWLDHTVLRNRPQEFSSFFLWVLAAGSSYWSTITTSLFGSNKLRCCNRRSRAQATLNIIMWWCQLNERHIDSDWAIQTKQEVEAISTLYVAWL